MTGLYHGLDQLGKRNFLFAMLIDRFFLPDLLKLTVVCNGRYSLSSSTRPFQ